MTTVLAIDQGTSATKAVVVDDAGQIRASATSLVRVEYGPRGAAETDPAELLRSVIEAGRRALDAYPGPVDAVALANQGESVLAWDRDSGRPLSAVVGWQDRRAAAVVDAVSAATAAEIRETTGLTLDPYFTAAKLAWVRRAMTSEGVVTTTDTWLLHRLCGAFVTDVATASRSMLLRLDAPERGWDPQLVSLFGLSDETLPSVVDCDAVVGETTLFGGRLTVAGLVVDQPAALLAQRCLAPGAAKCTYGTGAFLLAQAGAESPSPDPALSASVAWRLSGSTRYALDGQVYAAGAALRWLSDLGVLDDPARLDEEVGGTDAGGLLFVPALSGLAGPWWAPEARGGLSGLTLGTTRAHVARAVVEGIVAHIALLLRRSRAAAAVPSAGPLRVDGGLSRSAVAMQAQADVAQVPVEVYPDGDATAVGAAVCARLALEPGRLVADAVPHRAPAVIFEPRWSTDRAEDLLDRWTAAVEASLPAENPAQVVR